MRIGHTNKPVQPIGNKSCSEPQSEQYFTTLQTEVSERTESVTLGNILQLKIFVSIRIHRVLYLGWVFGLWSDLST